jgi:thymidylate kinase
MKLIIFEGIDGVGKTTRMQYVIADLLSRGASVTAFAFPSRKGAGLKGRNLALGDTPDYDVILAYFKADMERNMPKLMKSESDFLIIDRYVYSSVVYQGVLGEVGIFDTMGYLEDTVKKYPPDYVVYCYCDRRTAHRRISNRDGHKAFDLRYVEPETWWKMRSGYNLCLTSKVMLPNNAKLLSWNTDAHITDKEVCDITNKLLEN